MRKTLLWTVTLCLAVLASYSNLLSAAAQSKKRITVPAGTRILIRTVDAIDSSKQKTGFVLPPPSKLISRPKTR